LKNHYPLTPVIISTKQFSSIVIEEGLGFDTLPTLLLTSGSYVAQLFWVFLSNGGSSYIPNSRTFFMVWNFALGVTGSTMIRQLPAEQRWARYAGYCLTMGFSANFPLVLAMVSGNFGGFTKKMTVNAMVRGFSPTGLIQRPLSITFLSMLPAFASSRPWQQKQVFIAYCAANIVGPQLFFAHEAPKYRSGFLSMMICFGVGMLSCLGLRLHLILKNRRRDRAGAGAGEPAITAGDTAALDKTDKELLQFRYVY
jgi:hypothetical protein